MTQEKSEKIEDIIKSVAQELLDKMGFGGEVEVTREMEQEEERLVCNISTPDSNFLIGQHGVNLDALEHTVRSLVRKKTEERVKFILDINSYRREKNNSVIRLAREMANEAVSEKRAVVLRPMTPYERRLIHMELANNSQIETESVGEGENRKVIIKPTGLI
ncbi:MAG: protein jag [Patescibacteria group bacterium]